MGRFTGISRIFVLVAGLAVAISGCDKAEDMGRKVAHKSGDLVGKGATEFFSGVGEGVDAVKVKGPDVLTAISTRKSSASSTHPSPSRTKRSRRCYVPR